MKDWRKRLDLAQTKLEKRLRRERGQLLYLAKWVISNPYRGDWVDKWAWRIVIAFIIIMWILA